MYGVVQISAIVAVGIVEGMSHVNWRLYIKMMLCGTLGVYLSSWSQLSSIGKVLLT